MEKTIKLSSEDARRIYKTADESFKRVLELNFGKTLFSRPLGVWCLTKDKKAVKATEWNDGYTPLAVGVVTDDTAFMVHLEPQAAVPFGSTDVKEYDDIVYDTETFDNCAATSAIFVAHNGVKGEVWNDDKFPFVGSPATAYCAKCGGDLPTLATAKVIAEHITDINKAIFQMGGYVVCGWLWTSTLKKDSNTAFVVNTDYGDVSNGPRNVDYFARAVSAFHFEDFEF